MPSRIIALCRLNSRRNLNDIDISRLNLCLHKKIDPAVNLLAYYAKIANLRLDDYRLFSHKPVVLVPLYCGY